MNENSDTFDPRILLTMEQRENYQLNGKVIYVENNSTSQIVKFKPNRILCMEPEREQARMRAVQSIRNGIKLIVIPSKYL